MDRLKNLLVLFLCVGLMVVLARLPRIVAWTEDVFSGSRSGTMPMEAVQSTQPKQEDSDSVIRLLQMERNMYSVPVSAEQTSMTEEEVLEIVDQWMEDCQEAGIFTVFAPSYQNIEPYLCMDMEGKGYFGVIWGVELSADEEPYHDIFVHLDDATGRILYVNYQTSNTVVAVENPSESPSGNYDSYRESDPGEEEKKNRLERFADLYFRQLGYSEAAEYARSTGTGYYFRLMEDDIAYAFYSFGDTHYGEISVEFYVYDGGFYNSFP